MHGMAGRSHGGMLADPWCTASLVLNAKLNGISPANLTAAGENHTKGAQLRTTTSLALVLLLAVGSWLSVLFPHDAAWAVCGWPCLSQGSGGVAALSRRPLLGCVRARLPQVSFPPLAPLHVAWVGEGRYPGDSVWVGEIAGVHLSSSHHWPLAPVAQAYRPVDLTESAAFAPSALSATL